jgi:hypothetical protein
MALALLVWAVSMSTVAGYYYIQYKTYHNEYERLLRHTQELTNAIEQQTADLTGLSKIIEAISLKVNILIKYGNGSMEWHNATHVPLGATAYTATLAIAEVKSTPYEGLGLLVDSINGVKNNATMAWFWWYWDTTTNEWKLGEYSCNNYILHRNDTIAWTYQTWETWPPQPPT